MLTAEAAAFIRSSARAFLLTRRASGAPTGHPMTLQVSPDGDLLFNAYRSSAKVRNLQRDPEVSCVVVSTSQDAKPRWVTVRGTAEVLDREDGVAAWRSAAGGQPVGGVGDAVRDTIRKRLEEGKRVVIRIRPVDATGPRTVP